MKCLGGLGDLPLNTRLEFNLWDPHDRCRELTPTGCSLISAEACMPSAPPPLDKGNKKRNSLKLMLVCAEFRGKLDA